MIIKDELIEPHEIDVEESQYILYKPIHTTASIKGTKEKKPVIVKDSIGHYSSLDGAVRKVMQLKMAKDESVVTLVAFFQHYKKYVDTVTKALRHMLKGFDLG